MKKYCKEESRYEDTRKRLTRFNNHFSMSDKEIIEYLAKEIEQYRDKIKYLEECIRKKNNAMQK